MKAHLVAVLLVLGTASVPVFAKHGNDSEHRTSARLAAASVSADAAATQSATDASAPAAAHYGKTREQVREELIQAYRDGLLPFRRYDYPPSAESIRRNKERYAATHSGDARGAVGAGERANSQ